MMRDRISDQQVDEDWRSKYKRPPLAGRWFWIGIALIISSLLIVRLLPMRESQWSVLETSSEFTLYSLKAYAPDDYEDATTPVMDEAFGDFIYGKVTVTDASVKTELLNALQHGIAENKGTEAACFEPHHAIRAIKGSR